MSEIKDNGYYSAYFFREGTRCILRSVRNHTMNYAILGQVDLPLNKDEAIVLRDMLTEWINSH